MMVNSKLMCSDDFAEESKEDEVLEPAPKQIKLSKEVEEDPLDKLDYDESEEEKENDTEKQEKTDLEKEDERKRALRSERFKPGAPKTEKQNG